ncbi:MAG: hypothetical protein ACRD0N_00395, partial [Acidimicrobiales bacterium]
PEGRARAAEAALAVVAEHPSELVRDQYLMQVADRCRVDPDRLRRLPRRAPREGPAAALRPGAGPARRRDPGGPEIEALRLAVLRPEEIVARLHAVLFADDRNLDAFQALAGAPDVHQAIAAAGPEAADLLQRLAVEETAATADDLVAQLLDRAVHRAIAELEVEARADPDQALVLAETVAWLKLTLNDLPDPDAADRLVDWLVRWGEEAA